MTAESFRLVVACEPRVYRDVLATILGQMRPGIEVRAADSADLQDAIAAGAPHMVIASCPADVDVPAWITLYPNGRQEAVVTLAGEKKMHHSFELTEILAIVDRAMSLVGLAGHTANDGGENHAIA